MTQVDHAGLGAGPAKGLTIPQPVKGDGRFGGDGVKRLCPIVGQAEQAAQCGTGGDVLRVQRQIVDRLADGLLHSADVQPAPLDRAGDGQVKHPGTAVQRQPVQLAGNTGA